MTDARLWYGAVMECSVGGCTFGDGVFEVCVFWLMFACTLTAKFCEEPGKNHCNGVLGACFTRSCNGAKCDDVWGAHSCDGCGKNKE